ncbi:MAG: hypothetical protein Q8P22_03165 [Chloroflexota bacterium]|nr:hypothetical protein [Chloroflexota bacterium]
MKKEESSPDQPGQEQPEPTHRTAALEILWRCLDCGELWHRDAPLPQVCPSCGAPREHFGLLLED